MVPLFAVHLSDGILQPLWLGIAFVPAVLMVLVSLYRLHEDEIPRVALLTAAFFVATLIHIRLGPTSAHLLLNGPVGLILGRRVGIAIFIGLLLHVFLQGHGGFSTLGINTCIVGGPALLARPLYKLFRRIKIPTGLAGFFLGFVTVALSATLNALVLVYAGIEDWRTVASLVLVAHLGIAIVEGVVVAGLASYFAKVKPEFLGITRASVTNSSLQVPQEKESLKGK